MTSGIWSVYDAGVVEQTPLQRVREARKLSRARLAGLSNLTAQTIYNLERGKRPTLETARRIADALSVSVDDVFPASEAIAS